MNGAAELTLAAMVALAAHFQAGVDAMKGGDPAKAVTEMSAVIRADPGLPELSSAARLLRGQAYKAQSKAPEALEDFRWLATRGAAQDLRRKAREEFLAAGGKPESLIPDLPPLTEWKRMQEAIRGGEGRRAWSWLAAPFRRSLREFSGMLGEMDPDDPSLWFSEDDSVLVGQAIDEAAGTARLTFHEDGETIHVDWVQEGPRWLIAGMRHEAGGGEIPQLRITDVPAPDSKPENGGPAAGDAGPSPAQRAEIESCIDRLGAEDAQRRAHARARLREFGETARPQLQARAGDNDPEIATSIRELLARP